MAEVKESGEEIEMVEAKRSPENKMDDKPKETKNEEKKSSNPSGRRGLEPNGDKFAELISRLYGPDYIAARKLLNRRLKKKGMGAKPALSLYDRIMMYRKMKEAENEGSENKDPDKDPETNEPEEEARKINRTKSNNSLDSVDISQYTKSDNEARTPTPKPTVVSRQATRRTGSAHDLIRRKREQQDTLKVEEDDAKATPRDVIVDVKEKDEVIEERTTPLERIHEKRQEKTVVKEERTVLPPVRSATPQRPPSTTSNKSEEKVTLPPITKEEKIIQKEVIRETRTTDVAVVGAAAVATQSTRTREVRDERVETKKVKETDVKNEEIKKSQVSEVRREEKKIEEKHESRSNEKVEDVRKEESSQKIEKKEEEIRKETSKVNEQKETQNNVRKEESNRVEEEHKDTKVEKSVNKMEDQVKKVEDKQDSLSTIEEDARAVITSPRTPREATPEATREPTPKGTSPVPKSAPAAKKAPPGGSNPAADVLPVPENDDIEALDKLADYNLKSLMGEDVGDAPEVKSELLDKVFSSEFQNNLDNFLAAR